MSSEVQALKAHLALNVHNVERSIEFYQKMLGIGPSKVRTGYAKFDVQNPPLNLTLNEYSFNERGALSHLGIQVASTERRPRDARKVGGCRDSSRAMKCKPIAVTLCRTRPGSKILTATNGKCSSSSKTTWPKRRPASVEQSHCAAGAFHLESRVNQPLPQRLVAEAVGTAMLLAAVVGSGIMGERLAAGNVAIALLANSIATGGALVALILAFGPISGAHFNPVVTLAVAWRRGILWREVPPYILVQIAGAFAGVVIAHLMFGLPLVSASQHVRSGSSQMFSEAVASFGLLAVIFGSGRFRPSVVAFAVAAYIVAAYWFTASTSFANPAVTLARSVTDTFAGIRPVDAPAFIIAQIGGAAAATGLFRWFDSGESNGREST